MKFYSPLTADFFPNEPDYEDEFYDEYEGCPLDGHDLLQYADAVDEAVKKDIADFNGNLMQYYREDDSVRRKVVRAVPNVDEVNGELVGSLWVDTDAPLTAEEQAVFCAYISGQYSDGWGEGFEQREIDVGDGKLYVHFWQDHDFELKRDVPDMTEFKKLLNRPKKPKMQLIGQDGNIFAIMGRASRLLKNAGQSDKAKGMCDRVTASQSYSEALNIVSEYVETELSPSPTPKRDRGDAR
ncbi:hypothetical protein [Gemmiger formicilis]|uniref:hypothetical protein n=1 Tax=Gemmiger formicilis TaxID=745368 RepID=UPI001B237A78|nr:hypothetical protein [Gemmiger formicilis]MBO9103007.1 hypothetical protein [Escherichia coli]